MIYVWFTCMNYYKLAVQKDRDSIFYVGGSMYHSKLHRKSALNGLIYAMVGGQ
jgi:hypothetical protein